jgi:Malectin-like domain
MSCSFSFLILIFIPLLSLHFTVPAFAAKSTITHILVRCGTSGIYRDANNLPWVGDIDTKYISKQASQNSTVPYHDPSVPDVPFDHARIFTTNYTYTFSLSPGRYFLRLYFYPFNYSNRLASDSFFTATAGPYTLLSNFSALLTVNVLNYLYLIREFSINVTSSTLDLTFAPSIEHLNAYAFINGIEIISSPDIFRNRTAYSANGTHTPFPYDPGMAFQTMYRLNVGGRSLATSEDSGLYRSWADDSNYIFGAAFGVTFQNNPNVTIEYPRTVPQYIAPTLVYETARSMGSNPQINLNYNLTWILTVDAGFYYLLRFHFCEIQYPITQQNQRVFNIYINNQTAQTAFDVIMHSGGIGIPVYEDYVAITTGSGQMDMWIELHPNILSKPKFYDAILNGLEVFKMSMAEYNLAGLNPAPLLENTVPPNQSYGKVVHRGSERNVAAIIGGAVVGGVLLLFIIGCIWFSVMYKNQKKKERESDQGKITNSMTMPVSSERNISNNSITTDSHNSLGTFHDAR